MCGILYASNIGSLNEKIFLQALSSIKFRGPDSSNYLKLKDGLFIGHNRLELVGGGVASQPIKSFCGRYTMAYNGEIYNCNELSSKYNIKLKSNSDTALIIDLYTKYGLKIFQELVGMFAIVIHDAHTNDVLCVRDRMGIKPLYYYEAGKKLVISSMTKPIMQLCSVNVCEVGLSEWHDLRRQTPGHTFFKEVSEYLPGKIYINNRVISSFSEPKVEHFKTLSLDILTDIIDSHLVRDVKYDYASFLSGGVDSSIITKIIRPKISYTSGSKKVNEYLNVQEFSEREHQEIKIVNVEDDEFDSHLISLSRSTGEPCTLPNEVLIYKMCMEMPADQKIIFSGEGADELFFGYDNIVRFCQTYIGTNFIIDFRERYRYRNSSSLERFTDYINGLCEQNGHVNFIEDFLLRFHLTGLLKRADHATMVASKECRVPFADHRLLSYSYRQDISKKLNQVTGKLPLRQIADELGMGYLANRMKQPFTYQASEAATADHYLEFQQRQLEVLGWS